LVLADRAVEIARAVLDLVVVVVEVAVVLAS
jgi:hypothetical protein